MSRNQLITLAGFRWSILQDSTAEGLEEKINELVSEIDNPILLSETVIGFVLKSLAELKECVLTKGFKNEEEEILFFKTLKPSIMSKLIYYNTIYKIETKKPFGETKAIKKYLNNEINKLKRYFDNNLDFYKYYRTNSTYLDCKYFVRGRYDIKLSLDTYYFEVDQRFSTSHDYKVAKIIAYDLIQVYLEDQIFKKAKKNKTQANSCLNWTASKAALIELIYALHEKGVYDNGNADIKLIAKSFEANFNVELGDFYHTYLEIRSRKINRTKFLDSIRDSLIKKMDDQDEK